MSQIGSVGIVVTGVTLIAVDNIARHRDPFPQIMVGGLFAAAVSIVSEIDEGLAHAVAITFLVSAALLHSKGTTDAISKFASSSKPAVNTPTNTKGKTT